MKPEFLIALVGLGGTIIGAVIGAGVSVWITKQQLSLSYKQHSVEILQAQMTRLQSGLDKITGISIDVKDSNLSADQIHSRSIDAFLQRSTIFLTFSYLFPGDFEKKILDISSEINKLIYSAKVGQQVDENTSRRVVEQMVATEKQMIALIRERLRVLQSEFDTLTKVPK
jgi:hypothetical protein